MEKADIRQMREKITRLESILPHMGNSVYLFASYLGERLPSEGSITPARFYDIAQIVLQDLRQGVDRRPERDFPGIRMSGKIPLEYQQIAKRNSDFYNSLGHLLPTIAQAIVSEDFSTKNFERSFILDKNGQISHL